MGSASAIPIAAAMVEVHSSAEKPVDTTRSGRSSAR
jgi:hypothetical protein